jgi:hypothetical protein
MSLGKCGVPLVLVLEADRWRKSHSSVGGNLFAVPVHVPPVSERVSLAREQDNKELTLGRIHSRGGLIGS